MSAVHRKYGRIASAIFGVILLSIIAYTVCVSFFTIQTIEVVGGGALVRVDEKKLPKNLLFFPSVEIQKDLLRRNPILASIEFYKKFPHTLVIKPVMRTPVVILKSNDATALIDKDGVVLTYGDQGLHLPVFQFAIPVLHVGEVLSAPKLVLALTLLNQVSTISPVSFVKEMESSYIYFQTEKTGIFITQDSHTDQTIATLQTLFEGFRIKGTLPRVVDLRFDKPVVQF